MIRRIITAYVNLFTAPSLAEIVERDYQQAITEHRQALATVRSHKYLMHMAKARAKAISVWNEIEGEYNETI